MQASAKQWERFGREDAYFGVISQDQFRAEHLDDAARERFFATGANYVDWMRGRIDRRTGGEFRPSSVLDYGCGVGRVLIPLADGAGRAVGVDVSPSMLDEARRNASQRGLDNVEFVQASALESLKPEFDLVHSALVLQHIPVRQGEAICDTLAGLVAPGGMAVVQVPFRVSHWTASLFSRAMRVPLAHNVVNLLGGRPWSYPYMEMNIYSTDRLLRTMLDNGLVVFDLMLERGEGGRWRYDSCWLFARRPEVGESAEPGPNG